MKSKLKSTHHEIKFIVIGASLGGLKVLCKLFSSLTADYPLPIAVVLHRSKDSLDELLVNLLQKSCLIPVIEVEDKTPIKPGVIHVAPADYHLLVEGDYFVLSMEEPVLYSRPAIDLLFESSAYIFRDKLLGILLTGASRDGTRGLSEIKRWGGITLVQDPKTAEADIMPLSAIRENAADQILSVEGISAVLSGMGRPG